MLGHVRVRNALLARNPGRRGLASQTRPPPTQPKVPNLINFVYEAFPKPFNCTTLTQTRLFAADSSHPLHIKTQRRLAAHNPNDFIWVVRCPIAISKKPAYRHDVLKKLRRVFKEALRKRGYDEKGVQLAGEDMARLKEEPDMLGQTTVAETTGKLSGALSMFYVNEPQRVLMADGATIRSEASRILDQVLYAMRKAKQGAGRESHAPSKPVRESPRNKQEGRVDNRKQHRADRPAYSRPDIRSSSSLGPQRERGARDGAVTSKERTSSRYQPI